MCATQKQDHIETNRFYEQSFPITTRTRIITEKDIYNVGPQGKLVNLIAEKNTKLMLTIKSRLHYRPFIHTIMIWHMFTYQLSLLYKFIRKTIIIIKGVVTYSTHDADMTNITNLILKDYDLNLHSDYNAKLTVNQGWKINSHIKYTESLSYMLSRVPLCKLKLDVSFLLLTQFLLVDHE